MSRIVIFLSTLYSLLVITTLGQPTCKVEYYSTEQGLSHQRVTTILKDREGFMWFGSWDGINRFDGHSFVSYKSSPGDSFKLRNDRFDQIVEDQSNHLWIQSYDKQVYRFDKKNGQFQPISAVINYNGKSKLAFDKILSATNGLVWLQSVSDGVFCVSQNDLSIGSFRRYQKEQAEDYHLPSDTINFFYEDSQKQIWIGTDNGLGCLVNAGGNGYKNSKIIPKEIADGLNVLAASEDTGSLYFITEDGRLIVYNKKSTSFRVIKIAESRLNACLRSKKSNVIYFTTSVGDLIVFNLGNQQVSKINVGSKQALQALYEDRKGNGGGITVIYDPEFQRLLVLQSAN